MTVPRAARNDRSDSPDPAQRAQNLGNILSQVKDLALTVDWGEVTLKIQDGQVCLITMTHTIRPNVSG